MYNKIFTKILDSSIWLEPMPTRIVWLTFIAAMDEDGMVQFASPANVARRANVSLEDTIQALATLEGPDHNSSDPDHEGRRLEKVPGGWVVLNAKKYRDIVTRANIQERTRERVRAFRARKSRNATVTQANDLVTSSEAESESRSEANTSARAPDPASVFASPPGDPRPQTDQDRWHYDRSIQDWCRPLVAAGCKVGSKNWPAWEALIKAHTLPVVLAAARQVQPQDRWPDQAEAMIAKLGTQEPIGDAVRRKTIRIANDD